jgi:tRNA-Thr(GGU) m(6)t(6)A37 methyltransferase TsaA
MTRERYVLRPVGRVESTLRERADAPRQGDEGAPQAWVVLEPEAAAAARDLVAGDRVVLLTWLHLADRDAVTVHPRGDPGRPETGVFSTRSPDRPNPIGLHEVTVLAAEGTRLHVSGLEAVHGTPVLDIKPVLGPAGSR